ncbi:MAG TPA: Wzt carbohydrate-binding domain-containing protein [Methylomirabilota bacterium]|nr:Wzt carbohydrate-binding domain-containing protein [Methylomirabilota bacterium]
MQRRDLATGLRRVLFAIGIGWAGVSSLAPSPASAANSGFVTTQGDRFVLNGDPFYFVGTNAYFMMSAATYGDTRLTDDMMTLANALGFTVLRTWGFKDGDFGSEPSLQPAPGAYNETAFKAMDYVLWKADQAGMRLSIALVNHWADYGGMPQYIKWCAPGSSIEAFYTNPTCTQLYQDYVRYFLNRPNSYGPITEPPSADNPEGRRRYKDDPTVFAWELANEPRCRGCAPGVVRTWVGLMAAYVRSIDPNHMVASGEEGFDDTTVGYSPLSSYNNQGWLFNGSEGVAFTANTADPNIAFGSFHLYPEYWSLPASAGNTWITDHILIARGLGKPVLFGEFNVSRDSATVFDEWLRTAEAQNGGGSLVWQLICQACSGYGGYVYPPATAVSNVVAQAASRANSKSGPPAPLGFTVGQTTATPNLVTVGQMLAVNTSVTASAPASGIIVDIEIHDTAGKVAQEAYPAQDFAAGQTRPYTWNWSVPTSLPPGTYTVKVGVFDATWTTLYTWVNDAATFTVQAAPTLGFTVGPTTLSPNPLGPGWKLSINTKVTASAAATGVKVDLEIYTAGGAKIAQQVFSDQAFAAGQTRSYNWKWRVPSTLAPGIYTVKIGVFNADWSVLYTWVNEAATFTVK